MSRAVDAARPDVVIHAQALSDVDRCEQEPALARAMNVEATANLVRALEGSPAWLFHVSTDYVFDGAKGAPYLETDAPRPVSVYGRTKLEAEQAALSRERTLVVRPSTLYGRGRMNFCDFLLQELSGAGTIEAYTDQTTSPTCTEDMAQGLLDAIQVIRQTSRISLPGRVMHLANGGACTRLEFAVRVADLLGRGHDRIRAIRMADQRRPAARPPYSALASQAQQQLIGRTLRRWDEALDAYVRPRLRA